MKIAIYHTAGEAAPATCTAVVARMLGAMVRREPARGVVLPLPGGAAGAWLEAADTEAAVLAREEDGSFAFGDALLVRPDGAAALLADVRARGQAALGDLDGSFAAVVHDRRSGETLVATDRFATRPLYAWERGGTLALASEAKALFDVPGFALREDPLAIYDIINFGWIAGERTWFDGVSLVPDGTVIVLGAGRSARRRRYRGRLFEPGTLPEAEGIEAVADAFLRGCTALGRRTRRPAILLSGGLDSRTISSFCARAGLPLHCYTFGPRRSTEPVAAIGIARALGLSVERCETPPDLLPRRAAIAEWIGDGHVSLSDIHFFDHHVERIGPSHDGFFDGWLGGVIGGAYYCRPSDALLRSREDLAAAITGLFDFQHAEPLEAAIYEPAFLARLRERAIETPREFLADWTELSPEVMPAAKEAACLRFRDRRWQLFHNGVVAEPFCRGLRPYALGEIVDRFQALPLSSRMGAGFYQKLLLRHFPRVASVTWEKTGRPIGRPPSRAIAAWRRWRRLGFYYLARLTRGRLDLRDLSGYAHYDQTFRAHAPLRDYVARVLQGGACARRGWIRPGGAERLLAAEREGGTFFLMIARLLQAELLARLFLDGWGPRGLVPETIGPVRLHGRAACSPAVAA